MTNPIKNRANTIFIHVSNLEKSVIWYSKLLNQQVDAADISRPVYNLAMNQYTGITLDAGPSGTTKKSHRCHILYLIFIQKIFMKLTNILKNLNTRLYRKS